MKIKLVNIFYDLLLDLFLWLFGIRDDAPVDPISAFVGQAQIRCKSSSAGGNHD
jgi:hypothetical protein